ncbi:TrkA-C domain protein [Natrinema pellirubrum DSM 15624]|uniref:TrkA-C domain protein n=1 Tax=Natrinema pellirubrum (strain DSM 15624 / CIP 106293 / JCM 10476 / NCIMB 786 / 157) TaxID=797303 RepID=L0JNK2_NATP1|nr:TrkA C-terminal domain-containing protein [Natrinema pellirubrum]AGB33115.1 TrkA-like protein [Natrinema pellirubrum DSM 15624]ELY71779.1 TrkA-C domain protein [Natrinema pellirubrum DSM 15624]
MTAIVAAAVPTETLLEAVVRILGFALLAAGSGAGVAFVYRWYSADGIPEGIAVLFGVALVAIWLNTQTALQQAIIGNTGLLEPGTAIYTVGAFAASAVAADGGRRLGDYLARDVFMVATPRTITEVTQLVRSAGRVVTVELPDEIDDIEGYDPVDESVKADLAGQTFLLPRRLTDEELRERLVARLERDFGIGHVDVDLEPDGTVAFLAVGSRPAGIGPTLAPGTVAVALEGDPAADASPGDAVRIWARGEDGGARRIAGGELRGTAGDVATVALDAEDARDLEPDGDYRLVTLPGSPDAERDLVSLLRAADETVRSITVEADDPLVGLAVDSLPVLVLALEREGDADHRPLPAGDVRLAAGDVAYVLGRPDALRRVTERSLADADESATPPADDGQQAAADPDHGHAPERPRER